MQTTLLLRDILSTAETKGFDKAEDFKDFENYKDFEDLENHDDEDVYDDAHLDPDDDEEEECG